ncbi:type II secretion system ATPase GspE [Sedimenticola hydrogenitrophicus]|uniref:type II secretion system ATPase GspE n=1 Tax=Sedimenticola hydrogenitrophicus TaxID=2967975 RepID=UPI0023B1FA25|nr:type II secretion system ATPase GspE [Sedimenticola hydrogenitrophicus]
MSTSIPYGFAKRHKILINTQNESEATITIVSNTTAQAILEVQRYLSVPLRFDTVDQAAFERLLQTIYEHGSGQAQQMVETLGDDLDLTDIALTLPEPEDLLESADEAPIIRLINALLAEAIKENASDVHIEPYEDKLAIRLRVDGVLRDILHPQRALAPLLISRIKVMARLDIAEKRLPQDGRISLRIGGRAVDVRVSTLPASHGERVVLRLLDKQAGKLDLPYLGMEGTEYETVKQLIRRPHGIILVTGPTGSGKTTSLYAMLSKLNERSRNILTVEDPIEYYLDGIGQTQVNTKVDMSFARGLRAILRQDPDVVMVGEIRDLETAEIAVQASLTGHLVLSTLHTNTAIGAITRLRDMGIEPFLLSSSLIGSIAQRLVRKLCDSCKSAYTAEETERKLLMVPETASPLTLYRAEGCPNCNHLGFKGRVGIFEVFSLNDELRNMIHKGAGEHALEKAARIHSKGIRENARSLVLQGKTSLDEILRVTHEE